MQRSPPRIFGVLYFRRVLFQRTVILILAQLEQWSEQRMVGFGLGTAIIPFLEIVCQAVAQTPALLS